MKLDTFTYAYLHAAAFTEDRNPGQGEYLEPAIDDFDPAFVARAMADCQSFQAACWDLIIEDLDHAGGDFWYTRNGHGCGFWDGDWEEPGAGLLTQAAQAYGEVDTTVLFADPARNLADYGGIEP